MVATVCAFCSHSNAAGSSFCNDCGAALKLILCPRCEAVNHRSDPHCHKCGADLHGAPTSATASNDHAPVDEPVAAAEPPAPPIAAPTRNVAAVALIVIGLAAAASFAYYHRDADVPVSSALPVSAAIPEVLQAAVAPDTTQAAETQPKSSPAIVSDANGESSNDSADAPAPAPVPPEPATAAKNTADARPQRPRDREASSRPKAAATVPVVPPELRPPPQNSAANLRPAASCTDAVAALGLCNRSNREEGR